MFEWVEDISDFNFSSKNMNYICLKMTFDILNNWGCHTFIGLFFHKKKKERNQENVKKNCTSENKKKYVVHITNRN